MSKSRIIGVDNRYLCMIFILVYILDPSLHRGEET